MNPKPKLNNGHGFWNFNLGHAITIFMLVASTIGLYFKVDSRLTAVELLATTTSAKVERIDEHGSRKSQIGLTQDNEMVRANTNRITELEKTVTVLGPKIERIDVNIQWIMNHHNQTQLQIQQSQKHTGK